MSGSAGTPEEDPPEGHSGADSDSHEPKPKIQRGFEQALAASRLFVVIPVLFLLIDAIASFVYGCFVFVTTLNDAVSETETNKIGGILGRFLVVMDTYLVGATLMIAAFGFYSLFISSDAGGPKHVLPAWLKMRDLEDLKARVVSMLILVAAITFVDIAVETHDEKGVLYLGIGIAIVIVALTAFLRFGRSTHAPAISNPAASTHDPDAEDDAGSADVGR